MICLEIETLKPPVFLFLAKVNEALPSSCVHIRIGDSGQPCVNPRLPQQLARGRYKH